MVSLCACLCVCSSLSYHQKYEETNVPKPEIHSFGVSTHFFPPCRGQRWHVPLPEKRRPTIIELKYLGIDFVFHRSWCAAFKFVAQFCRLLFYGNVPSTWVKCRVVENWDMVPHSPARHFPVFHFSMKRCRNSTWTTLRKVCRIHFKMEISQESIRNQVAQKNEKKESFFRSDRSDLVDRVIWCNLCAYRNHFAARNRFDEKLKTRSCGIAITAHKLNAIFGVAARKLFDVRARCWAAVS